MTTEEIQDQLDEILSSKSKYYQACKEKVIAWCKSTSGKESNLLVDRLLSIGFGYPAIQSILAVLDSLCVNCFDADKVHCHCTNDD